MQFLPALIAAIIAFVLYGLTAAPSIQPGDAGELAAAAATLGIAHPTGYPIFTLMGWAVAHIPFGTAAWKLNHLMAALCAFAVFFFCLAFQTLLSKYPWSDKSKIMAPKPGKTQARKAPEPIPTLWTACLTAVTAALLFGFSKTFWSQALSLEVYALHLLFLSLTVWILINFLAADKNSKASLKWGHGLLFTLGLSFANHLTTLLILPAFVYLYIVTRGIYKPQQLPKSKYLASGAACFVAGLLPYLYLPLRAAQDPLLNWGDPTSPLRFWRHVTGAQFKTKMFSTPDTVPANFFNYLSGIPNDFGWPSLVLALLGFGFLIAHAKRVWVFSLILFVTCILYAINYDIPDIASYFLLANFAIAIWILFGIQMCFGFAKSGGAKWVVGIVCLALISAPAFLNYSPMNRSADYVVEDYSRNVLASVDSRALLLSDEEQDFLFPVLYLQNVEKVRSDVAVVNVHLLRFRWGIDQIRQSHPEILRGSEAELTAFLEALRITEAYGYGASNAPEVHSARITETVRWNALIRALILNNLDARPVYATSVLAILSAPGLDLTTGIEKIPTGLTFRLFKPGTATRLPSRDFAFRSIPNQNPRREAILTNYAAGYSNQGMYQGLMLQDTTEGVRLLRKSLSLKPDYFAANSALIQLGQSR